MSTSARRKRSRRFYWAEIGFLVLGLIALKPEILTELIPTGRNSSQLASQAALNQVAMNNALFGNASLAAGGNAVFVPVSGTLLYPANYLTPTSFASAPVSMQTTQPSSYTTASYSAPYLASNGIAPSYHHSSQANPATLQTAGWGQQAAYGDWSTTYPHASNQPSNPTQNVTSMMASTSPSGLQVVWPDSYRPIAAQPAPNYVASNAYSPNPQYGSSQYGSSQYGGTQNGQYRGTPIAGTNVANGYVGAVANSVASGAYPQYAYPQSSSTQSAYPPSAYPPSSYPSSGYAPNTYSKVNNTANTSGGYRNTSPATAPPVVGRY